MSNSLWSMDCSWSGSSSIHGIFQARILEWVTISFSRESSRSGDWTQVSHTAGRLFTWATREVLTSNLLGLLVEFSSLWLQDWGLCFPAGCQLKVTFSCECLAMCPLPGPPKVWQCPSSGPVIKQKKISPFCLLRQSLICCSVTKSCLTLWDTIDCSMPGFPVLHYLLVFAQTHVHWVCPPSSPPVFNLSQHQGLSQWLDSLHQVSSIGQKFRSFSFSISPCSEYSGSISWVI